MTFPAMRGALCASLIYAAAFAQEVEPQQSPPEDPVKAMQQAFADNGIEVDREAGTVTVPVSIVRADQPLEYLLIGPKGKSHEALFVTDCLPSVLNTALLLLGYQPGKNLEVVERVPQPTEEEFKAGAPMVDLVPPTGTPVWMTLRYQKEDAEGEPQPVEVAVEDLILDLETRRPIEDCEFIYLGGRLAPINRGEAPVFFADYEGNHISAVYKQPANHLITIKHAAANDDTRWWRTDATPEPGVAGTLVLQREESATHAARRERIEKEKAAREAKPAEPEPAEPGGEPEGEAGAEQAEPR